jgi:uncharacterized protein (TIGR03032 family)
MIDPESDLRALESSDPRSHEIAVQYEHSGNLPDLLQALRASVLLSTYQAGKLVVIGSDARKTAFSFHSFDQVMGIAVGRDRVAIGARRQIHFLRAAHEVAPGLAPAGTFDGCFLTRTSITTGSIHGHDLAFGSEGLWVVNTLFSCLCTLDEEFNFVPRWRPPFISQLIDQDRCHLNGLALEDGKPRYVTVLGLTDEPAGWRSNKRSGGAILDVPSGQVVAPGLCMPHSPRVYGGKLWVLNSGCGELAIVDTQTGKLQVVASLPGYTRGLAFFGNYAFVGLSRIRETNIFGGLPIGEHREKLLCGLGIVELATGRTIATLQFKTGVEELFAVEVLPGIVHPKICGPSPVPGQDDEIWIVPPLQDQTMESRVAIGANEVLPDAGTRRSLPNDSSEVASANGIAELLQQSDAALMVGDKPSALSLLKRAISLEPNAAVALNQLGNLYQELNDQESAIALYQRAVAAQSDFAPAHQNLGVLWTVNNEPLRALHHFEKAEQSAPHPMNKVLAAKVLPVVYQNAEQVAAWRQRYSQCVKGLVSEGIRVDTTHALADTSFYLAYQGENDREIMADLGKVYFGPDAPEAFDGHRPSGRKIKVGFLSAYFRDHTIGRLNLGRIRGLSRDAFEVTVLVLHNSSDPIADAFRQASDHHVVLPRQVQAARRRIAELGLDILVFADIGMDALTQSLCYSRMAPIQASTWGHPDTSGSPAIDYFVSSELAEADDAHDHYTERLELLDTLGVYYTRPQRSGTEPARETFGFRQDSHVYLCPQTSFKFHPSFDQALRGILESDPLAELAVLKGRVPAWTQALQKRWEGVFPDGLRRVSFINSLPQPDFLHLIASADVVLDPFPFCGGNTSYESFAMGAPLVTYPARFLRGRLTHAMYRRMGIDALTASSTDAYVKLAVRLGTDHEFQRDARKSIASQAGVLFENPDEIASWDRTLRKWIDDKR